MSLDHVATLQDVIKLLHEAHSMLNDGDYVSPIYVEEYLTKAIDLLEREVRR